MTKTRRGGRPSKDQAEKIEAIILDAAADLFFTEGYGLASIENIAKAAHISKRTFYARFENKAALFRAVVHRILEGLKPADRESLDALFEGTSLEDVLRRLAPVILKASLSASTLALLRLVFAEAERFPELALITNEQGSRKEATSRIAKLMQEKLGSSHAPSVDYVFAAEQFLHMLTASPQRRALGLGTALKPDELSRWAEQTVTLFLHGVLPAARN